MGRKTSSRKSIPTVFNKPKTNISKPETNSIGNSIKQGMATGVGVGIGHAATMGVINSFSGGNKEEEIDQKRKNCINLFKMYTKCLESSSADYNCTIIKEEFENCSKEF